MIAESPVALFDAPPRIWYHCLPWACSGPRFVWATGALTAAARSDWKGGAVYAIIETGSKQYRVTPGQVIDVELLPAEPGSAVEFDRVLLVGGDDVEARIGTPVVAGAKVVATVTDQHRGDKVVIFKMRAKKRYRRKTGHRQELTRLTIDNIVIGE